MNETTLTCPECDSEEVTLSEIHKIMANTYEHYCYSVKVYDDDAQADCLDCDWSGLRLQLKEKKHD